jgi:hypothetical protein
MTGRSRPGALLGSLPGTSGLYAAAGGMLSEAMLSSARSAQEHPAVIDKQLVEQSRCESSVS